MSEPTVQIPRQHLSICEHPRLERAAPRLLWSNERTQARRSRGAGGQRECGKSRVERQDSLQRCVLRQQAAPVHHVLHSAPHRRCHTPARHEVLQGLLAAAKSFLQTVFNAARAPSSAVQQRGSLRETMDCARSYPLV